MKKEARISLEDFAAVRTPRPCAVCDFKEIETINAGRRNKQIGSHKIIQWLLKVGYTDADIPSNNQLDRHFRSGHHLEQEKAKS